MRIFVIENHPDTLNYLKMHLESVGHSVTTACTMQAALAASPTENCDVLLSDLGLPDGDGWQLMELAKFPQPVYAVAMSGFAAESDFARSKAAGFRRHIVKPFGGEDLREALEEAAREIAARLPEIHVPNAPLTKRKKPVSGKNPVARKTACLTPGQIADRLHHSTCQNLVGAHLLLCVLRDKRPQAAAEVRQLVENALAALDEASADLGALIKELRTAEEGSGATSEPKPSASAV
ncbi:MAG: response regulator [Undibacterium sp.]|nr:response regulator [Opitutaceae bacterium]